jgi:hypothetical protein
MTRRYALPACYRRETATAQLAVTSSLSREMAARGYNFDYRWIQLFPHPHYRATNGAFLDARRTAFLKEIPGKLFKIRREAR